MSSALKPVVPNGGQSPPIVKTMPAHYAAPTSLPAPSIAPAATHNNAAAHHYSHAAPQQPPAPPPEPYNANGQTGRICSLPNEQQSVAAPPLEVADKVETNSVMRNSESPPRRAYLATRPIGGATRPHVVGERRATPERVVVQPLAAVGASDARESAGEMVVAARKDSVEAMRVTDARPLAQAQSNGVAPMVVVERKSPAKSETSSPPRKAIVTAAVRSPMKVCGGGAQETSAQPGESDRVVGAEMQMAPPSTTVATTLSSGESATATVTDAVAGEKGQEMVAEGTSSAESSTSPKGQKSAILKLATYRTPTRKLKTIKPDAADAQKQLKAGEGRSSPQKSPGSASKSKRVRTKTQLYQSPLPEVELISKITAPTPRNRNPEEKLIIFYKNEFLAVRNSEGGFYICQAMQNIYKSSPRIKIRWLSQEKSDKSIYSPDFYDYTDFDCILTNLNLMRVNKQTYRLPPSERQRTDSILKRALAVENGDAATPPSLSEEHPDGIDLSLYTEESQLNKPQRGGRKRKGRARDGEPKTPDHKVRRVVAPAVASTTKRGKMVARNRAVKRSAPMEARASSSTSPPTRTERAAKRKHSMEGASSSSSSKISPVVDPKKARVLAKVVRKKGGKVTKTGPKGRKPPMVTVPLKAKATTSKVGGAARKSKRGRK